MYSCGTRAKFLFVICRLKSLDTWTRSLSAVFTSSGDFSWASRTDGRRKRLARVPLTARTATIFLVPFIFIPFCVERLRCHMQYPIHVYGMARSGTEKRIVTGRVRRKNSIFRLRGTFA